MVDWSEFITRVGGTSALWPKGLSQVTGGRPANSSEALRHANVPVIESSLRETWYLSVNETSVGGLVVDG